MALEFHPAANLFPLLNEEDDRFRVMVESIRERGLIHPIVLHDGMILDGRNRYRACSVAGVEIRTMTYTGESPTQHAIDLNLGRRDLTDDQRGAIAVEALPMIEAETKARMAARESATKRGISDVVSDLTQHPSGSGASRKTAAQQFDVSEARVRRTKALKQADQAAFEEVKTGKTTLKDAEKKVRTSKRPELNPAVYVPGQVAKPRRAPREDPALVDRLYKTIQAFPDKAVTTALAEEAQAVNLDLPDDAIRKLTGHLKQVISGGRVLVRGLEGLSTARRNGTA